MPIPSLYSLYSVIREALAVEVEETSVNECVHAVWRGWWVGGGGREKML